VVNNAFDQVERAPTDGHIPPSNRPPDHGVPARMVWFRANNQMAPASHVPA